MCDHIIESMNIQVEELGMRIEDLEQSLKSAIAILDVSGCCDCPLYRDDIDVLRGVLRGSKG